MALQKKITATKKVHPTRTDASPPSAHTTRHPLNQAQETERRELQKHRQHQTSISRHSRVGRRHAVQCGVEAAKEGPHLVVNR